MKLVYQVNAVAINRDLNVSLKLKVIPHIACLQHPNEPLHIVDVKHRFGGLLKQRRLLGPVIHQEHGLALQDGSYRLLFRNDYFHAREPRRYYLCCPICRDDYLSLTEYYRLRRIPVDKAVPASLLTT